MWPTSYDRSTSQVKPFTGIHNEYGLKKKFIIYLDPANTDGYLTDFFQDKVRSDAFVYENTCVIEGITYDYRFVHKNDELFFIATERYRFYNFLTYLFGPGFMLGSDKMEV